MIVIAGATGTVGREATRLLTDRATPFRALSRTPTAGRTHADPADPASLGQALTSASALLLIGPGTPDLPAYDQAFLAAAERAGVTRVVKLSSIPVGPVARWHRAGEEATRTFPEWTLLRPSLFASNSLQWAPLVAAGEPIPNPTGDARLGVVDPRDLAEVAVAALLDDHHGRTYTLTGPELLSAPEQVAVLAEVLGRPLTTVDAPLAEYAEVLRDAAIRTDDIASVLGRPARDYATWARECYPRP
ncbi:NAD(P)H-binding protein [Saccharothrix syringae]|uniref:SDR family NAD(P)-dependent oxidoreductase n=1 Tax=Saccharothrix syringae TaxID=103733 RepID=A0A5Q0H9Y1_SACSY|nr:NAD(P)H-binding protein [Saccharothrix syringae]QFZ23058.1 SDR family NAD(P)-dependent oxidoreductase [Saccharothrix syringae]